MKKFLLALIIILWASTAHAANWYVDNAATGSNNGTSWANAWKSFASVVWGSSGVKAGDTLYISGGATSKTYNETLSVRGSGAAGSPITIRPGADAGHNGQVVIDCQSTRGAGIELFSYKYVTIDGVKGDAVHGDTNYGMKIKDWYIASGQLGGGIYSTAGPSYITIKHIEFTGTNTTMDSDDQACVRLSNGVNFEVAYCWGHGPESARDVSQDANKWHTCGVIVWAPQVGTSYTSTIVHDSKFEILYHDGIKATQSFSFYNNELCDIGGSGHSDAVVMQTANYGALYNNYIHGRNEQCIFIESWGGQTTGHLRVYNNIIDWGSQGIVMGGFDAGTVIDDVVIANNTFYRTYAGDMLNGGGNGTASVTNVVIVNNIFGNTSLGGTYQILMPTVWQLKDANSMDHNVYMTNSPYSPKIINWMGSSKTLAQAQALSPARELNGKYANPVFVNPTGGNFHISPTDTVVKGAGVNMSAYFTTDKDGNPRPQTGAWDIGAYSTSILAPPYLHPL